MFPGQLKDGERLGDIVLGPTGELRCCVFVGVEEPIEFCLSIGCVFGVEDISDVVCKDLRREGQSSIGCHETVRAESLPDDRCQVKPRDSGQVGWRQSCLLL